MWRQVQRLLQRHGDEGHGLSQDPATYAHRGPDAVSFDAVLREEGEYTLFRPVPRTWPVVLLPFFELRAVLVIDCLCFNLLDIEDDILEIVPLGLIANHAAKQDIRGFGRVLAGEDGMEPYLLLLRINRVRHQRIVVNRYLQLYFSKGLPMRSNGQSHGDTARPAHETRRAKGQEASSAAPC